MLVLFSGPFLIYQEMGVPFYSGRKTQDRMHSKMVERFFRLGDGMAHKQMFVPNDNTTKKLIKETVGRFCSEMLVRTQRRRCRRIHKIVYNQNLLYRLQTPWIKHQYTKPNWN